MYVDKEIMNQEFEKSKKELFSYLTYLSSVLLSNELYSPALVSILLLDKVEIDPDSKKGFNNHKNEIMQFLELSAGPEFKTKHVKEANKYIKKRLNGSNTDQKIILEVIKIMTYEVFSSGDFSLALMILQDTQKIYPSEEFTMEIVANLRKNDKVDEMIGSYTLFQIALALDLKDNDHIKIENLHIMSDSRYQELKKGNAQEEIKEVKLKPEMLN